MSQWGFYFNQDRCVGCKTCVLACKTWNDSRRGDANINISSETAFENNPQYYVNVGNKEVDFSYIDKTGANNYEENRKYHMKENWRRVTHVDTGRVVKDDATNTFTTTFERRYLSISCNHCSNCVCIDACPMNVFYKDESGLTLIKRDLCISCGRCKAVCPYDAPQFYRDDFQAFDQNDPARPKVTKCTLCKDRIDVGLKPACVAACWNRALDAGPIEELKQKYEGKYITALQECPNETGAKIIFTAKKNSISQ